MKRTWISVALLGLLASTFALLPMQRPWGDDDDDDDRWEESDDAYKKWREREVKRTEKLWKEEAKAREKYQQSLRKQREGWDDDDFDRERYDGGRRYYGDQRYYDDRRYSGDRRYYDDRLDQAGRYDRRYDDSYGYESLPGESLPSDAYELPPPLPQRRYGYREQRYYAPEQRYYQPSEQPTPRYYDDRRYVEEPAESVGARIGGRIGELIGGPEGAAIGSSIGADVGVEVDRSPRR